MSIEKLPLLEKRIVEAELELGVSNQDLSWLTSSAFSEFLGAWKELVDYYQSSDDDTTTQIGCEVLSVYLRLTRFLSGVLNDRKLASPYDEEVEEALATLETYIDQIISKGYAKIHRDEDRAQKRRE